MEPNESIVPEPTEIKGIPFSYTWDLHTEEGGALLVGGTKDRVRMIWWEAIRKDPPAKIDVNYAACVRRADLEIFLEKVLEKIGVTRRESRSFVDYWSFVFSHDFDPDHAPYLLIQLVEKRDLEKYLPRMAIQSKRTYFELHRFYFLFLPVALIHRKGLDPNDYLESLIHSRFSLNSVIDLGGEVVPSADVKKMSGISDSKEFINEFIENHIRA